MAQLTRRRLLAGMGATTATAASAAVLTQAPAHAVPFAVEGTSGSADLGPVVVTPSDRRYQDLVIRGYNRRFTASPDSVRVVGTTQQVVDAVNAAVRSGKKVVVRSGGHCLENFVDAADNKIIIDMVAMRRIAFDTSKNAFCVETGATLGEIYRTLYYGWGVTIPGGSCPTVGAGGHFTGGGFGVRSRQHGLVADHIHAVEVVVVDSAGQAKAVVATRDASDPNNDLWWAHTGGGGGNFGIVTRFWLRSKNATGTDPGTLLPKPPGALMNASLAWKWSDMTKDSFRKLFANFGAWHEQNSAPGAPGAAVFSALTAPRVERGTLTLFAQVDPTVDGNPALLDSFVKYVTDGVVAPASSTKSGSLPWLTTTLNVPTEAAQFGISGPLRSKSKGALLKKSYSADQVGQIYDHLTDPAYGYSAAMLSLLSYGGAINSVAPKDTATFHRSSVIAASFTAYWDNAADDAKHDAWLRGLYGTVYASTGGVPTPDANNEGSYINWPDRDFTDPKLNTSGAPWYTLFYGDNYSRLKTIKAKWDPKNVFSHALSVQAS
ncbi:FAD-binding oxidoreductase [Streptomyces bauhiniae]|uniref:FAD-binding oxidoreductase n=1 Tax=Streptomyces bauhiniae TaxID=2340725 RepID=UPI003800CA33